MSLFQKFIYSKANTFLLIIISFLGYTSCRKDPGIKAEYGCPSAEFIIKGKITASDNGKEIPAIKAVVKNRDSVYSNATGYYELSMYDIPQNQTYFVDFIDVDSSINGNYKDGTLTVEFTNPVFTGGDGSWNQGKTEKTVNITLSPKQ